MVGSIVPRRIATVLVPSPARQSGCCRLVPSAFSHFRWALSLSRAVASVGS